jgi:hypothetical protein
MTEPPVVSQLLGWLVLVIFLYAAARLVCWLAGEDW